MKTKTKPAGPAKRIANCESEVKGLAPSMYGHGCAIAQKALAQTDSALDALALVDAKELAELRKDRERLDWLEKNQAGINMLHTPKRAHVWTDGPDDATQHFEKKTYRAAVDAARFQPSDKP